ncbi:Uncharacterised protein [Mycobacteroides abscessus]|nr:Uncharacterised protein [Mycobacteroides abscessus]
MTSPPRNAPLALPTLSAEWHSAAPSDGADGDRSMSRVWSDRPRICDVTPRRNSDSTAGTGCCPVSAKSASIAPVDTNPRYTVRITERSASRPPSTVPTVMPTPKIASTSGTAPDASPVTRVTVGST